MKKPSKLQEFHLDFVLIAETVISATAAVQRSRRIRFARMTRAISDELGQVESLLETLTPEAGKESATSISKLQTKNLELELELTRAKIELARLQSDMNHVAGPRWGLQIPRT